MSEEKLDWYEHSWFKHGVESGFPLCCIMWFMHSWHEMDEEVIENWSSDRDGYIPCPKCLLGLLELHNPSN